MEITIIINKHQAEHLACPHCFSDECSEACEILYKVQDQIEKEKMKRNRYLKR